MADFIVDGDTQAEPVELTLTDNNDTLHWNGLLRYGQIDGGAGEDTLIFNGTFNLASRDAIFFNFETITGTLRGTADDDWVFLAPLDGTGELTIAGGAGDDQITGSGVKVGLMAAAATTL